MKKGIPPDKYHRLNGIKIFTFREVSKKVSNTGLRLRG